VSRLEPNPPVVRYEHSWPGEMINLGIKSWGTHQSGEPRITGTVPNTSARPVGKYLYTCTWTTTQPLGIHLPDRLMSKAAVTSTCFLI